ncbi:MULTISPECIES: DMT family transporter [Alicyclobacillus]|uniref:DMT family transporter n=1 Tax=Alicyclobacillus TaxID=29330 RepID=UPI001F278B60|nr:MULTISPECIES: DMT family transporter [Alicyclobacillus]
MKGELNLRKNAETQGFVYGFLGVLGFSLTLPASREAVPFFGPIIIGFGRALIAAVIALTVLLVRNETRPSRNQLVSLALVGLGAIIAFPYLSAWAMDRLPASHGAVILALLPLATAGAATLRNGERPSIGFWVAGVVGAATVLGYAVVSGLGRLQPADLALVLADIILAFSYAEGGRLATTLGGWQVIAWALVITAPFLIIPVSISISSSFLRIPAIPWLSLMYLGIGSQFLAFVAWYTGLSMGGVARVSQIQYLQPFLTILFSAVLLREKITVATIVATMIAVFVVIMGKRATVRRVPKLDS